LRATKALVNLFPSTTGVPDSRGMFYTSGQNLEIVDLSTFTDGYPVTKYKNVTSAGAKGSDPDGNFPDTDFPLFRLADVYLMYAECVLATNADKNVLLVISTLYVKELMEIQAETLLQQTSHLIFY
jgi:SusD family.